MWEINNASQLMGFFYSVLLGIFYCLLYDVIRAIRAEIRSSSVAIFIGDIIYSLFCAISCFCFLLSVTGGELRIFVFLGIALGFIASRLTVSKPLHFILRKFVKMIYFVYRWISDILNRFFAFCEKNIELIAMEIKKIIKKLVKSSKKS